MIPRTGVKGLKRMEYGDEMFEQLGEESVALEEGNMDRMRSMRYEVKHSIRLQKRCDTRMKEE